MKWTRSLIPTEACDQVVHHRPGACSDCGAKLSGDDQNPKRHQITDLPPVKPIVTEHQIHTLQCPDCGHRCRRQLPATLSRGCFGSGVVAVVTLLSSFGRLSQRMISGILQYLYQLKVADGQISRLQSVVGKLASLFAVRPSPSRNKFHHLLGSPAARLSGHDRSRWCFCRNWHAPERIRAGTDSPLESTEVEEHSAGYVRPLQSQAARGNPRRASRRFPIRLRCLPEPSQPLRSGRLLH